MKTININNRNLDAQNNNIKLFVMPEGLTKKETRGLKLLMERSLVGEFTPLNRYYENASDILNRLAEMFILELADTAHEVLVRIALPESIVTKNILKMKKEKLQEKPGVRTKLASVGGKYIKEVHTVSPSFPEGFGEGFMSEGRQIISYDTDVAFKCYDIAARKLLLDVMAGGDSPDNMNIQQLQEVLKDQKEWIQNGHLMGQKSFCSRLRSYWNAGFILNAGASKWMRSCIRIAKGPKTKWETIKNSVCEFYGALTSHEDKYSWSANLKEGETAFFKAVKEYKEGTLTLEYSSYEEVWAYRLVKEYVNNEETITKGERFFWTVPVEFDQHASFAAYQGALLGSREILYFTNAIRTKDTIDIRKDFYGYNTKWHRALVKPMTTQPSYGKSLKGGAWPILKKDKGAMELLEKLGVLENGSLKNDTPEALAIRKEINEIWKWVLSLPTVDWATKVVEVANKFYSTKNWETNRFSVDFGNGDFIVAECSKLEHDKGYDEEGVYVDQEKIDWVTENMPRLIFSRSENKLKWISKEISVPRYVHPNFADFGRFMPTGWTHHQDAVTMDMVMATVLSFGWEAYSIHDAIICHPAVTETVQDIVRKRLLFIYKNREFLMETLFSNWGENPFKDEDPFGIRSNTPTSEISDEEFMNGRPMKF